MGQFFNVLSCFLARFGRTVSSIATVGWLATARFLTFNRVLNTGLTSLTCLVASQKTFSRGFYR